MCSNDLSLGVEDKSINRIDVREMNELTYANNGLRLIDTTCTPTTTDGEGEEDCRREMVHNDIVKLKATTIGSLMGP